VEGKIEYNCLYVRLVKSTRYYIKYYYYYHVNLFAGETTQMHTMCQVVPDAWRSEVSHVRSQWIMAFQMSHL
jgi:hypothetical protein